MKKQSLKKASVLIGIVVAICQAGVVLSHQLINSLTAADAVDHFLVTCSEADNHHLFVQIDDLRVVDNRQETFAKFNEFSDSLQFLIFL
ncbi:MAG: hypothetical protein K2Q13_05075 [Nitrosomonas sp.]|uniref:hypothetical protein n=1 Tax=Nitrosomonas sp. TaxID=42353 RepID=UPI0025DDBFFC|nr:hypothetical protein [Nitrosomonas sp.]MBY0474424.1 hypothetical protein [Nitrosomonas sp.]